MKKKSRAQRARELGIHVKTLKYREDPEFRERRKKIIKKSYLKHREERLERMKEYYYNDIEASRARGRKYWANKHRLKKHKLK